MGWRVRVVYLLSLWVGCSLFSGCTTVAYHTADAINNKLTLGDQVEDQVIKYKALYALHQIQYNSHENFVMLEVYDQRVLVMGGVDSNYLRHEIDTALAHIPQVYRVNDYLEVGPYSWGSYAEDSVITGQVQSMIMATEGLGHFHYDVYTTGRVVYLCGQADPQEEQEVVNHVRQLVGVKKVVTIFPRAYAKKAPVF